MTAHTRKLLYFFLHLNHVLALNRTLRPMGGFWVNPSRERRPWMPGAMASRQGGV